MPCIAGLAAADKRFDDVITELEFKSLAADGYNRIPLIAEAFADLETPLSLYLKLVGTDARSRPRPSWRRRRVTR